LVKLAPSGIVEHSDGVSMTRNLINGDPVFSEFTMETYRKIANLASFYSPASYTDIPWEKNFILFRHDVDISLNRALALARVDAEFGVRSTFFINPLGDFYSVFEDTQRRILFEIVDLGHDIGLHFDASRHKISGQEDFEKGLSFESGVLTRAVREPVAFSFHNPSEQDLEFENESYMGLVNAYSRKIMASVEYASDSNGYWRHKPIDEVLVESAGKTPVQILTHPEWWQDTFAAPRNRVARSLFGRAQSLLRTNDSLVASHGRRNITGMSPAFQSLALSNDSRSQTLDTLWNMDRLDIIFIELWRLRESQINKLAQAHLRKVWGVPAKEVNAFFASHRERIDGRQLFELVFERSWLATGGFTEIEYIRGMQVRNKLVQAFGSLESSETVEGLHHLSDSITKVAKWGLGSALKYDGLAPLESIGIQTFRSSEDSLVEILLENIDPIAFDNTPSKKKKWNDLKSQISKNQAEDE
jgi:hypothetical protein